MKVIVEGKAKKILQSKNKNRLIQYFKDDATAFNNKKKNIYKNKGIINNSISAHIFEYLNNNDVKTHFLKKISDREQEILKVKIIPVEVVVRNFVAGSLQRKFNIKKGKKLKEPVIELYLKEDKLNDPFINDEHVDMLGLCSESKLKNIKIIAKQVNTLLIKYFNILDIILVDFKLEFGEHESSLLLADEISPDNCRLWDKKTKKSLDKDVFRNNDGDLLEEYQKVYSRIKRKYVNV